MESLRELSQTMRKTVSTASVCSNLPSINEAKFLQHNDNSNLVLYMGKEESLLHTVCTSIRSLCSLHTSPKVTVHLLKGQTTNVCAVDDFT